MLVGEKQHCGERGQIRPNEGIAWRHYRLAVQLAVRQGVLLLWTSRCSVNPVQG